MEFAWTSVVDALPIIPGAYALMIDIDQSVHLPSRRFSGSLPPGRYCYVGSAHGPGGIRARCARHLRRQKHKQWHVDWLTNFAARLEASPHPGETECALLAYFLSTDRASIPIPGFGSSDCPNCPAHLVQIESQAA